MRIPRRPARQPAGADPDPCQAGRVLTVLIAEYTQLKTEQNTRIGFRDNLLYATVAAIAAAVTAAKAAHGGQYLLLLPPVTVILGWTYLVNDHAISAIGRYLHDQLAPRLAHAAGSTRPVLGWETAHRHSPRRRSRKLTQLAVDQAAFCVPAAAAVAAYWLTAPRLAALPLAVSAAETAAAALLSWQITAYTDRPRPDARDNPQ